MSIDYQAVTSLIRQIEAEIETARTATDTAQSLMETLKVFIMEGGDDE